MSRYDGLIIPRSYSEYINKTDAATLQQALQLSGVMDNNPTENSNNPAKSGGIYNNMIILGGLKPETDLNTLLKAGIYGFGSKNNVLNGPTGLTFGMCIVLPTATTGAGRYILQKYINAQDGKTWYRTSTSGGNLWNDWVLINTTV